MLICELEKVGVVLFSIGIVLKSNDIAIYIINIIYSS